MSISPIEFPSIGGGTFSPQVDGLSLSPLGATGATERTGAANAATGAEFGDLVLDGIDRLEGLTDRADGLAVQAATGNLDNIHDYTIAASEAQVAGQLTVALRNRAVEAFNEIMRMQV